MVGRLMARQGNIRGLPFLPQVQAPNVATTFEQSNSTFALSFEGSNLMAELPDADGGLCEVLVSINRILPLYRADIDLVTLI
jgi:hypothetical protein